MARIGDNLPSVPDGNAKPTAADLGLSRKDIHEARLIRDAEASIQARAVRRCGELLKQYDGRGRPAEIKDGAGPISQRAIAGQAGMSERQVKTAVRVANVPAGALVKSCKQALNTPTA